MSASQSPRAPWRTVHRGARPRVLPLDTPAISWGGCREESLARVLRNLPMSQAPPFALDPQPILGLQLPYRQPLFSIPSPPLAFGFLTASLSSPWSGSRLSPPLPSLVWFVPAHPAQRALLSVGLSCRAVLHMELFDSLRSAVTL